MNLSLAPSEVRMCRGDIANETHPKRMQPLEARNAFLVIDCPAWIRQAVLWWRCN